MTNEKALEHFTDRLVVIKSREGFGAEYIEATEIAIQAIEKQIPMKVVIVGHNPNYSPFDGSPEKWYQCPECRSAISGKYCKECGQKLDWTEENKWNLNIYSIS